MSLVWVKRGINREMKKVKVKTESSETSKSKINFYLIIYEVLSNDGKLSDIVDKYGISKQNLNFVEQLLENAKQILNKKNLENPISSKYDYIEVVN